MIRSSGVWCHECGDDKRLMYEVEGRCLCRVCYEEDEDDG